MLRLSPGRAPSLPLIHTINSDHGHLCPYPAPQGGARWPLRGSHAWCWVLVPGCTLLLPGRTGRRGARTRSRRRFCFFRRGFCELALWLGNRWPPWLGWGWPCSLASVHCVALRLPVDLTALQKQPRAVMPFIIHCASFGTCLLCTHEAEAGLCTSLGSCARLQQPRTLLVAPSIKWRPHAQSCTSTDTQPHCEPHQWSGCLGKGRSQAGAEQGEKGAASSPHLLQAHLGTPLLHSLGVCLANAKASVHLKPPQA